MEILGVKRILLTILTLIVILTPVTLILIYMTHSASSVSPAQLPTTSGPLENGLAYYYGRSITGITPDLANISIYTNDSDNSNNYYYAGSLSCGEVPQHGDIADFNPTSDIDNRSFSCNGAGFLTKINADRTYGYTYIASNSATKIKTDSSGNIYILGSFYGDTNLDLTGGSDIRTSSTPSADYLGADFLTKINADGTYAYSDVWTAGPPSAQDITVDSSGNVYISGSQIGTSPGYVYNLDPTGGTDYKTVADNENFAYFTKINANNTYAYSRSFATGDTITANRIRTDSSNDVYVLGTFSNTQDLDWTGGTNNKTSNGGSDLYVSKYDSSGNYILSYLIGGSGNEGARSIGIDHNDNLFIMGYANGSGINFDPTGGTDTKIATSGDHDFLTKINSNGTYAYTQLWDSTLSPTSFAYDHKETLAFDSQNKINIIINGWTDTINFDPTGGTDNHTNTTSNHNSALTVLANNGTYDHTFLWEGDGGRSDNGQGDMSLLDGVFDSQDYLHLVGSRKALSVDYDPNTAIDSTSLVGATDGLLVELGPVNVAPTDTPTATPTSSGGSSNPPVCADSKPATPSNLVATAGPNSGQVILTWTAATDPVADYSITYSDDPNVQKYGVVSTGKVTTYTISALNPNIKYYFWVNAINGCKPGDQIGPATPTGGVAGSTNTIASSSGGLSQQSPSLPITGPGQGIIITGGIGLTLTALGAILLLIL